MKKIFFYIFTAAVFFSGCGDSFNSAQDYLTGPVNGVGLKSSTSLVSGGTERLYPVVSPPKTSNKNVTWTSSDSSKVSVDSNGVITAVTAPAHGTTETAIITAITAEGGYTAQCNVTVTEKPVATTGVSISQSTITLHVGNQGQLTAAVTPADATNQNLAWTSSNSSRVAVDASGLVTAVAGGTAIVTVTTVDGGYKASCTVTSTTDTVYIVTYNGSTATGGNVPVDTNTYLDSDTVTVMGRNTLYKTSNTFTGWNTSSDGSGTTYTVGSTFTMGPANVTLYAKWTSDPTYTIKYDGNFNDGGSVPADNNPYLPGDTVTVKGNTGSLIRTGYAFGGWYKDSGSTYSAGDTFTMTADNITLLAKWVPAYKVTYLGNGSTGGTVPVDSISYTEGSTVTVKYNTGSLSKAGYLFHGWYASDNKYYYPGQSVIMGNSNVYLIANWGTKQVITAYTTINIYSDCIVTVKAWGAGGQGLHEGTGGGGGYSFSVFTATAGDILHIVVGAGGGNTVDTSMPALGGTLDVSGGGGSLAALYRGGTYYLKCCAGGGGGGAANGIGGAGGGSSGGDGSDSYAYGGSNGIGGIGTTKNGSNMPLTSPTLKGFNGDGANGTLNGGGAGGGGYGGGGVYDVWYYSGGGGGGYCEGSGSWTDAGSGSAPGNNTDSDLLLDKYGWGGSFSNGGNGYVIVSIVYN